ncbi:VOC family protein [Actinokineospora soli]|uniref:VOC family protein n=1 Tax=Actinokineospora soli TaxID=1048753 RepID=A0ABW2TKG0_9PSEU
MVVRKTAWPAGTPCWVDVSVDDIDRAKAFYGALFGWDFAGGDPEFGGYLTAVKGEHPVAGLGPKQSPDQPSVWTTYLASDDVAATTKAVGEAGGQVVVEPMQVGEFGTMAIAVDPAGGMFGIWESGSNTGVDLANEPGSLVWNEHMSGASDAAKDFYTKVFGYTYGAVEGAGEDYSTIDVAGAEQPVGGIGAGEGQGWVTYFQVEDADTAIAKVKELGGSVVEEPFDTPYGRMAGVADDQGTTFKIMGNVPQQ